MTTKPDVFLTFTHERRCRLFPDEAFEGLLRLANVTVNPFEHDLSVGEQVNLCADSQVVISDRVTPATAELFERLPNLVAYVRPAMDVRNIDVAAATKAGVLVVNGSPGWVDCVSELIVGLLVSVTRRIPDSVLEYRSGLAPKLRMGRQLSGGTLGIVGYGNLGRRMAELGTALNMHVLVHDPNVGHVDPPARRAGFAELLAASDYVVCLAVHQPATENLFDERAFGLMKSGGYFVNASRGGLVDEAALEQALTSGHLAGAALDVGREPDDLPNPRLASLPSVVATPHVGGYVREAIAHHAFEACSQVQALLRGERPSGSLNWNPEVANRVTSFVVGLT